MTPAARVEAAIALLDRIRGGVPAEQALTNWGRASRFAGSGDRAAVRDHVFDALRRRRSAAALGGAGRDDSDAADAPGRALMLGLLRQQGVDPATVFGGAGRHAPAPLGPAEAAPPASNLPQNVALDCPEWLAPRLAADLGARFAPVLGILRERAGVFVRVNARRAAPAAAIAALAAEGIAARAHPLAPWALELGAGAARLRLSRAYAEGLVELQDAASQAVVAALPLGHGMRVLDFCAGGGGKTLAMAAQADLTLVAHDRSASRLRDLPVRAARAGIAVEVRPDPRDLPAGGFDLVLADAPCSGSGAWRRQPEAKWTLTDGRLAALGAAQAEVLEAAARRVAPGGVLAYATCSILRAENEAAVAAFVARSGFRLREERRFDPCAGGDGFYLALLDPPARA
ncbi:MAG: RsmB/NOP family class I SAM-dependent RNA methyltransferase [Alphaproteobacteria bacterium]|nr:RsmB/NOP family class I SAM-dependent RNA methyltransferase [Alphaproteobacteria bacterium]